MPVEKFAIRGLARSCEYMFSIYGIEQSVQEWTLRPAVSMFCIADCVWGVRNLQYLRKTVAYFTSALIATSCKENVHAFSDFKRPHAYKYPGCCVKE
jgi:hypothetical protein